MDETYIKLFRGMCKWEWYTDQNTKCLFLHLLLNTNFRASKYLGHSLKAGTHIIGRKKLAFELGLSEQQIRTSLKKLESTNEITIKVTNKFSICTIVKWADFQCKQPANQPTSNQQPTNNQPTSNQQVTNNQPTSNQQVTTEEEGKKERRKEGNNKSVNYASFPSLPKKQLLDDWLKVRRLKKAMHTQTAMDGVGRELHKALANGYSVESCFLAMAEKSWAGFNASWMDNVNENKQATNGSRINDSTFKDKPSEDISW